MVNATHNLDGKVNLTKREIEILKMICLGNTLKTIANMLFLSHHTIVSHKKKLIAKFKAKNIVHLGVLAERKGYLRKIKLE